MSDRADIASGIEADTVMIGLSRISAAIPAGTPGECDDCGENMPRLVDGLCAFCRDGRRPPLSFYDRAPALVPPSPAEEKTVPTPPINASRKITIEGRALRALDALAASERLSFKDAAERLILQAGDAAHSECPSIQLGEEADVVLANIPDAVLIEELQNRLSSGVGSDDYDAAIARAEAAEARWDRLKAAFSGADA